MPLLDTSILPSPNRPVLLHEVENWDDQCDVIVVGFGAAGACAAIEAANTGAQVTVFEVASDSGGAAALSAGDIYMGGNDGTPIQQHAGFRDTTDAMARYLLLAGGPQADADKVQLYAQQSTAHFAWLVAQGVRYKNSYIAEKTVEPAGDDCLIWSGSESAWPFSEQATPCPRGHLPQWSGPGRGRYLMDTLSARVSALGAAVFYNSRVLALIVDDHQAVHGIVVRRDNNLHCVRARRGVILCAGGFIMNTDMLQEYAPHLLRAKAPLGTSGDDGTAMRMAMHIGAATLNMAEGLVTLPFYPPASLLKGILINEYGERFINEDCYHGRTGHFIFLQPGTRVFLLADNAIFARPKFAAAMSIEIAAVAESWDELAEELNLPPNALVDTIKIYNDNAMLGNDPQYHKAREWLQPLLEPPFVALDCSSDYCRYSAFTLGGLATLPSGEVLNQQRDIIPGLFAAGRTTCGLPRWGGGYSSGLSLGDATFFGRMAGLRAAGAKLPSTN